MAGRLTNAHAKAAAAGMGPDDLAREGQPSISSSTVSDQDATSITLHGVTRASYLPRTGLAAALAAKASELLVPTVVPAFPPGVRRGATGQLR